MDEFVESINPSKMSLILEQEFYYEMEDESRHTETIQITIPMEHAWDIMEAIVTLGVDRSVILAQFGVILSRIHPTMKNPRLEPAEVQG